MGEDEGWLGQPSGLLPNGLLLDEPTPVFCHLNAERWLIAEERIAELIGCIQPNQPSEDRRIAVADYVQRLITKCFPCQVFTFGSVPLKTYLPDGDIDLTAFCNNPNMKETWAALVRDILESEEKNENAEFRVKEVQYIQAEVKIIKCLVENIVVDISFNQLGGLCTLCFLEEIDHLISENHLFKRSIILIKAWCYYESRILGAHHGLISTYALETLVLYIFHVFNNSFAGPLEVLYRFLEFFSNFDWGNFCVSLWGPVPISSLPDVTPIPPRKDGGELLLTRGFLEKCNAAYAVFPAGQESQGQPFLSKHFNVIDPLRVNNNLGRSVSKGNFFRIRSAFAFGAKRLARLLECPQEEIVLELNQFFMNTWERHGSGIRPDAPTCDFPRLMHSNVDHLQGLDNRINISSSKKKDEKSSAHESAEGIDNVYTYLVQHSNLSLESNSAKKDNSSVSHAHTQKGYVDQNTTRVLEQSGRGVPNQGTQDGRSQRSLKFENSVNEYIQGKYLFARTRSSPELTDTYIDTSSRSRHNKAAEGVKNQVASAKVDGSRRKNGGPESMSMQGNVSSADEPPVRHTSLHQNVDIAMGSNNLLNNYVEDSGLGNMIEERASVVGAQGMLQEEQDLVNMMSSSVNNFAGQVHMPLNLASSHLPLPFSPSMLASLGYAQRNFQGLIPGNIPFMDPAWASNLQFAQGLVPSHMAQYFPRIGSSLNSEDLVEQVNENYDSAEIASGDADKEFWHERDGSSNGRFSSEDGNSEWLGADDRQPSTSGSSGFAQPSQFSGSSRHQQKYTKESRGQTRDDYHDKHPDTRISDGYPDDRVGNTRHSSTSQASSLRSRSSSESSWNGSSQRVSKATREKKGRKSAVSTTASTPHVKGKSVSEHVSVEAEDDSGDWNAASLSTEVSDRSSTSQPGAALYQAGCQLPGFDAVQTSGSESCVPMSPMILGPGHRQRTDGSGVPPFAFYPTGPPVPFFTMLPVYNIRSDASSSDVLPGHQGREEGINVIASSRNIDPRDGSDDSEVINAPGSSGMVSTAEPSEEPKDILNSDFVSHWKNLQYGRQCQNPHMVYPSPVLVPPSYLQGSFPWDGPGRPLGTNVNPFPQITGYGPRLVPISSVQTVPDRPTGAYPRYVDDMPRYRAGTGTYLPNPKASFRDRYSSGTRRNNYNYDRNEHHGDRDGNWNTSSKSRPAGRSHNRNQADKSSSRFERLSSNESRSDRSWNSHRHESQASYQSQNGPVRPNSSQSHSASVTYGMYPLPGMNPNGVSSNGPAAPPLVMFYPYDNSSNFGSSPGEPLEFGSLGPMGFMGSNEVSQLMEGARGRGPVEDQRFHGSSGRSSPDQPSSPHLQRRV